MQIDRVTVFDRRSNKYGKGRAIDYDFTKVNLSLNDLKELRSNVHQDTEALPFYRWVGQPERSESEAWYQYAKALSFYGGKCGHRPGRYPSFKPRKLRNLKFSANSFREIVVRWHSLWHEPIVQQPG